MAYKVCKPADTIMVTEDIVRAARRVCAVSAREEKYKVHRKPELGAQGLRSKVSSFYLLGNPKEKVPRIEGRGDALHERAAAYEARHLIRSRSWCVGDDGAVVNVDGS